MPNWKVRFRSYPVRGTVIPTTKIAKSINFCVPLSSQRPPSINQTFFDLYCQTSIDERASQYAVATGSQIQEEQQEDLYTSSQGATRSQSTGHPRVQWAHRATLPRVKGRAFHGKEFFIHSIFSNNFFIVTTIQKTTSSEVRIIREPIVPHVPGCVNPSVHHPMQTNHFPHSPLYPTRSIVITF